MARCFSTETIPASITLVAAMFNTTAQDSALWTSAGGYIHSSLNFQ
jgi:hypothetical protein